jgi:flagellar biosynthetic protein FliR
MLVGILLELVVGFALVGARIGGFVAISPFPGDSVGRMPKIGLVVVLTLFAAPLARRADGLGSDPGLWLVVPVLSELAVGAGIGACFRMLLASAEVLGALVSQSVGLAVPSVVSPALGTQETALTHATTLLAMLVALASGAHRVAVGYLVGSMRVLPLGSALHLDGTLATFIALSADCLTVGVRLAAPVLAVSLAVQMGLALLSRAAPSLQLFSVGFAILVATGLLTLSASLPNITRGLGEHVGTLGPILDRVLATLAGG